MKHRKNFRKLNRSPSHRKAMLRNLVASLFEHGRVVTTLAKAKEARRLAEPLITLAKEGTLAARRRALQDLPDKKLVHGLFTTLAQRYANRHGGYTRIIPWKKRLGDKALKVYFELVEEEIGLRKKTRPRKKVVRKTKREMETVAGQKGEGLSAAPPAAAAPQAAPPADAVPEAPKAEPSDKTGGDAQASSAS